MNTNKKIMIMAAVLIILVTITTTSILRKENEEKIEMISSMVKKAEDSIKNNGILELNNIQYPKSDNILVEVYYKESCCLKKIKDIADKFEGVKIEKIEKTQKIENLPDNIKTMGSIIEFPVVILKEKDKREERIIAGISACSEKILTYTICDSINNPPIHCSKSIFARTKVKNPALRLAEDKECYENCFVEYNNNNNIINQLWHGPPCKRIEGYTEGISKIVTKECLGKSCKSDSEDRACCNKDNCVYQNKCYNERKIYDVDSDGQKEVCTPYEDNSIWIDPDKSESVCSFAKYNWLDCKPKTECINGINKIGGKQDGLCCGDDEGEFFTECKGEICQKESLACCNAGQCVFENKCYNTGCRALKTDTGTKKAYCDGRRNTWIDLDKNEQYCKKCLGPKSWSGYFCCGDDKNEGRYYDELMINNGSTKKGTGIIFCTNKKSQCISPANGDIVPNGCYSITETETNISERYYCKKGEWYDTDLNKGYCEECGFNWIADREENNCCGNNEKEYFTIGKDGTSACCNSSASPVNNGKCCYYHACGNGILEGTEKCEPTNTNNNIHCTQTTETCFKEKLGTRDGFGDCDSACGCQYDEFSYSCTKGKCNAECNNDKDCNEENTCNMNNCKCEKQKISNLSGRCPHKVHIKTNKKKVYINETIIIEINIYDKNNKTMPSVEFWLDIIVDNEIIGASLYSTGLNGKYTIKRLIGKNSYSGLFRFVVKVTHENCNPVGDSVSVEFITQPSAADKKRKLTEKIKREIIEKWKIEKINFEQPICGNSEIEIGEICEGNSVCRASLGCDYTTNKYDIIEYCNNCNCPEDRWSEPNSNNYCKNCRHCGDNILNCDELCDNETIYAGNMCENDALYERFSVCTGCDSYENITSEILADNCSCDCPETPEDNCIDGNYISYPENHFAGCHGDECNECKCEDIYKKDTNKDNIEDKCGPEICGNRFDDNDNGIIDEKECIWFYCSQCGHDLFNICDKEECREYKEGCFFEEAFFDYGFCSSCSLLGSCEDYYYDKERCIKDPCNFNSCLWNNITCCTDTDKDNICGYNDNCPNIFNPLQENKDGDSRGSKCDLCDNEPYLFYPQEYKETICNDSIDNDCDYLTDCEDKDCFTQCINISIGAVNESK